MRQQQLQKNFLGTCARNYFDNTLQLHNREMKHC
jgi:hypothetical protein